MGNEAEKEEGKTASHPLTANLLHTCYSGTANGLQSYCKAVAVVLQSILQRHCKKDAATLQWTYSNLTVRSQDFKVWRY